MQLKRKLSILVFLLITVVFAIGFVYEKNNERRVRTAQEQVGIAENDVVSPTSETQKKECDPNSNWKTFNSKLTNLSFQYPPCSVFEERMVASGIYSPPEMTNAFFQDTNYEEVDGNDLSFRVYTNRDQVLNDVSFEELSHGKKLWKLNMPPFEDQYTIVRQKALGMYQITGFSGMECSPGIESILLVAPPQGSDLKAIYFSLGTDSAPLPELDNYCVDENPDKVTIDKAIRRNISAIQNEKEEQINKRLNLAIQIAKTFQTRLRAHENEE